jgi:hypothetical protein
MLTLFTIPKAFVGHNGIIQRNALLSWTLLQPRCEILLLGNDAGTAEIANEIGARHIPGIACNEYGTPLLDDIFAKAQDHASNDLVCYVNADIILMNDFLRAVTETARQKSRFLLVGQRCDVDMTENWDFSQPDWENRLREFVAREGQMHGETGMDYFAFPRYALGAIPPFAIGRTIWDNWLIYQARQRRLAVVDGTAVTLVVHQNHDYSHVSPQSGDVWKGLEARKNRQLGGWNHVFVLRDATYALKAAGRRLVLLCRWNRRYFQTLPILEPRLVPLANFGRAALRLLRRTPVSSEGS